MSMYADHPLTLDALPLILAGPILQHAHPEFVTVWVALKQPHQVTLQVYETTENGAHLTDCVLAGTRATVALGRNLHVVAVTARSPQQHRLSSDRLYAYDLQFRASSSAPVQSLHDALGNRTEQPVSLSYFAHQQPTFALPPRQLQDLRIIHGSCRKPHGDGYDSLALLDELIGQTAHCPSQRPHQLFLTGDQIYADDVADPLLWVASQLGDALLGWEERLPLSVGATVVETRTPQQLPPGQRAAIATQQGGFTAGLHNKRERVTSHLLSLGEYYASYMLAWSPVCWPTHFPRGREMLRDRPSQRLWDREVRRMQRFIHTLWKVRRALANIPVYTIFDDHDVSDDWNLNQAWCLRVLGRPLGRHAVQNALMAYAVFQAWGNTPWQFEPGTAGNTLLQAAAAWSRSHGTDAVAYDAIARYVGMPDADPFTGLPKFERDGDVLILHRHPDALTWHYTVESDCHEVIVLDTRTWRGYPSDQKAIAPPMLLCPHAFKEQLIHPLTKTADAHRPATFVVAPTNVFELQVIDWIHHWQLRRDNVFSTDVGDAWNIHQHALALLITTLFQHRQQVIVLSGDIHYSAVVRLSYADCASQRSSVLVQLTASAFKNAELITQLVHTRLKDWLLPEPIRRWAGWLHPVEMLEQSKSRKKSDRPPVPPDWQCALEWIERGRAQSAALTEPMAWLRLPHENAQAKRWQWLQPFKLWRSRWFQDGREVVGVNNLALVQFQTSPDQPPTVIQDLYWVSPWFPTDVVYSRYQCPLVPNPLLLD